MKPRVSIVMPAYNRAATIRHAIARVEAQTFEDWELVVVDDGSSDGTCELAAGVDPRVRVIVQRNEGVAGARNTGLREARGDLVAFLDPDDAWPSHHLALASAFFDAHPGAHVFTTELWEGSVKHFRVEVGQWYPEIARKIGSSAFDELPPRGDPYLWFYDTREDVGAWARRALEGTGFEEAHEYRGENVFPGWRWGWLMALEPTVITRHAMETVGPHDTRYRVAADFGYLAELCRAFPVTFVSVPGALARERPDTRSSAIRYYEDVLRFHEELFWKQAPGDPELRALRGFRQSLVARAALRLGERDVALANLDQAVGTYPGRDTSALRMLARAIPEGRVASLVYRALSSKIG